MLTSFVDESPTKKILTFEVPAEDVKAATEKTIKVFAKQVRLPGFRPGKAPAHIIRQRFTEEIKGEVLERLIQESLAEALREKNLIPLGQPKIADLKFEFEAPLAFKVDLEVRPAVEPKDYRGLKVPAATAAVTAEDVDRVLGAHPRRARDLRRRRGPPREGRRLRARRHQGDVPRRRRRGLQPRRRCSSRSAARARCPSSRPTSATPRRERPSASRRASPRTSPTRSSRARRSSTRSISSRSRRASCPRSTTSSRRLALTPREGEAPEGASLAMLREKIEESVTKEKEQAVREQRRRAALDGLLALNDVPAPESMVESEIDSALKEYARHMARQGVDLKEAKIDWNELRKEARPSAERRVKEYLLLDAIGDKESLAVTDTELDAEIKRRAQSMGMSFTELKGALVKADRLEGVREELRIDRVVDFLVAEAVVAG